MSFQDVETEGGIQYAKLKRHYPYQDYHEVTLTAATAITPASYVVGTNLGAPGLPLPQAGTWGAKDVLFWGDADFFISFNAAIPNIPLGLPLLERIPANTYVRFHPHSAFTIYLAALLNVNVRIWMEG